MKKDNFSRGLQYVSPDIIVQNMTVESGFAASEKWNDASKSSADFYGLSNDYDGEFE